jgi:hypothetical protein
VKHLNIISGTTILFILIIIFSLLLHSCNQLQDQNDKIITGTPDSIQINSLKSNSVTEEEEEDDQPLGLNDQD